MGKFKVGDMVIMKRKPTREEWEGIGEIPIPNILYQRSHKILDFGSHARESIKLDCSESSKWFPTCCFELLPTSPSKKDRLIAEARIRYPKGTIFYSAESGTMGESFHQYEYEEDQDKLLDDGWAVYYKGKWAKVDGEHSKSVPFNIGDRVVGNSLADDNEYDITCEGWEGYVYKINGDEIQVGYTKDPKESDDKFWVKVKCFDLYTEPAPLPGRKFKVGDKVIANSKTKGRYAITIEGWIGEVKNVLPNNNIEVYGKGLENRSPVDEDCFDLYKEGSYISSSIKTSENGKAKHDDSERVIKVSQPDFEVSRGNQIRGSRINGSASEVTIGNRHRHYEARPIRG